MTESVLFGFALATEDEDKGPASEEEDNDAVEEAA
jgi:hypothetical protein